MDDTPMSHYHFCDSQMLGCSFLVFASVLRFAERRHFKKVIQNSGLDARAVLLDKVKDRELDLNWIEVKTNEENNTKKSQGGWAG